MRDYDDFELQLFDRLEVIKKIITKYGEDKFYVSFSGGKDSTIQKFRIVQTEESHQGGHMIAKIDVR